MESTILMPKIEENIVFSWYDYGFVLIILLISMISGIYFGFIKKQSTADDYLLGGREMSVIPIAFSLIASKISGLTLLVIPTDVYNYGITYFFCVPMLLVFTIITNYIYMPVFYELGVTSSNEYLKQRFDSNVRTLASALFILCMFMYLPVVIYGQALSLSQSINIDIDLINPLICGVCIFYTTFGGLKAVVWADAFQFIIIIGSIVIVLFLGVYTGDGFGRIWQKSLQSGRLDVSFSPDMTVRNTFWSGTVGLGTTWLSYMICNQGFIQKCNALPKYKSVKSALTLFAIGTDVIITICVFIGLIIFARYSDCDPLLAGKIKKADQILPYFIMDIARIVPGLAGLFMSGMLSATLSTFSASMNCLSAAIYEDFISRCIGRSTSEKTISNYLKLLTVVIGCICTALVYTMPYLGNLLPLTLNVSGISFGPLLGIFTCGMLLPGVNNKGALWGGIISLVFMTWIVFGAQYYQTVDAIKHFPLPLTTNGCYYTTSLFNTTVSPSLDNSPTKELPFILYRLSFYYYVPICVIIMVVMSVIISKFTPQYNKPLNKKYFSPVIRRMMKDNNDAPEYDSLPQNDKMIELGNM